MADWYVEQGGTGDGTTQSLAAGDIQTVIDTTAFAGGDTIWCATGTHVQGTDFTNPIDFDGYVSTKSTPCEIVGCNASWVEDGSVATWDGNGAALTNGIWRISSGGMIHMSIRNIRLTNNGSGGHGLYDGSTGGIIVFDNCRFDNNAGSGSWVQNAAVVHIYNRCRFDANTQSGWECLLSGSRYMPHFHDCLIHGNSAYGVESLSTESGVWTDTVIFNNTLGGVNIQATPTHTENRDFLLLKNCTIQGNGGYGIGPLSNENWLILIDTIVRGHNASGEYGLDANGNAPMPTTGSVAHMHSCSFTDNWADISDSYSLIGVGHQHSDPSFADENPAGGADLTPGASWAGLEAASSLADSTLGTQYRDIGAVQRQAPAGGGAAFDPLGPGGLIR